MWSSRSRGAQKNLVNDSEHVSLHRELKDRLTEQIIGQDYPVRSRNLFDVVTTRTACEKESYR